jgi:hypothetical protein
MAIRKSKRTGRKYNYPSAKHISEKVFNRAKEQYEKTRAPDLTTYDGLLRGLAKEKNSTPQAIKSMLEKIAYHETGGTMDSMQKQVGGGPGRGLYQYEADSLPTAQGRAKNFYDAKGVATPDWIKQMNVEDATTLSSEQQSQLALLDMAMMPKFNMENSLKGDKELINEWSVGWNTSRSLVKEVKFAKDIEHMQAALPERQEALVERAPKHNQHPRNQVPKMASGGDIPKAPTVDNELVPIKVDVANNSTTWNSGITDIINNPSKYNSQEYIQAVSRMGNSFPDSNKIITTPGASPNLAGTHYVPKNPSTGAPQYKNGGDIDNTVYTNDPNDPGYLAYKDSSDLHDYSQLQHQLENQGSAFWINPFNDKTEANKGQFELQKKAQDLVNSNPNISWENNRYAGTGSIAVSGPNKGKTLSRWTPEKDYGSDKVEPNFTGASSPDIKHSTIKSSSTWQGRGANFDFPKPNKTVILTDPSFEPNKKPGRPVSTHSSSIGKYKQNGTPLYEYSKPVNKTLAKHEVQSLDKRENTLLKQFNMEKVPELTVTPSKEKPSYIMDGFGNLIPANTKLKHKSTLRGDPFQLDKK